MQCPNCQFENMPGNARCVRCGGGLALSAVAVAVEPPRASARAKQLRRWFPWQRLFFPARDGATAAYRALGRNLTTELGIASLPFGALLRLIVPGWAHIHLGQAARGRAFLFTWLALMAASVVCLGSAFSAVLLGLAIAVHVGSILELLWRRQALEFRRIILLGAIAWAFGLAVYLPAMWTMFRVVDSRQWNQAASPLAAGDVVLFNPRAYRNSPPAVGDVVIYRNAAFTARGGRQLIGYGYVRVQGEWLDRIIAGPGSVVRWKEGQFWVDDRPSDWRPLNPDRLPAEGEITVPQGCYCILPTTNPFLEQGALRADQATIPVQNVLGRAIVRNYPFWRFWWIR